MDSPLRANEQRTSLNYQQKEHIWSDDWISPQLIIRFPQVRKTFEKGLLQELADDIAKKGLIQPSMVAKLTPENFGQYVDVFEKISKTKLLQSGFPLERTPSGQTYHYVLVAGERRYRAQMILWDSGCTDCKLSAQGENRTLLSGECFRKHFPEGLMEVRVGLNIKPEEAKSVQFRENNHVRPPAHEEAYGYRDYYDYLKTLDEKLSFKEFAAEAGVSVEKIRRAIWFCELPIRLRDAVESKMISYSNALELKRILQEESLDQTFRLKLIDAEVDFLLIHPRVKNEDYKKRVDSVIASFQMATLFDITEFQLDKKGKRKIVEGHLVQRIGLMDAYVAKVELLRLAGVIGKNQIYSGISPTKQVRKILREIQGIIPGFKLTLKQQDLLLFNLDKP